MELWIQLGIALGLGLLVGLQRERAGDAGAGIRTFPLVTVFGLVCALLARAHGGWVLAAGLLTLGALVVLLNIHRRARGEVHPGPTTEIAVLLMFGIGAVLVSGQTAAAVAAGGLVLLLLQWKKPLHGFVERIGEDDLRAVSRLVLIGLVVLPVLPDRTFGPYDVLNPFRIWLLVVLIVGISVGGYLSWKFLDPRSGSVLAGLLGGVISSTATTVSYARRRDDRPDTAALAALVIMIASTVVFVRVAVEITLVAPRVLPAVLPQLVVMTLLMALICAGAYLLTGQSRFEPPRANDPSHLRSAVFFGILYAVVLFGVAAAREHFGDRGLYVAAALSGLTDMDAITLSTAHMMETGRVAVDTGWRMMLVGAMSNLVFKGAVVAVLGSPQLRGRVWLLFSPALAGGAALLWLWP